MRNDPKRIKKRLIAWSAALIALLSIAFTVLSLGENSHIVWSDAFSFFGISSADSGEFVKVIDVGQGDCTLISSEGRTALIDCGGEVSQEKLCRKLIALGIENIDIVILTHYHTDHIGGIDAVYEEFGIGTLIIPDHQRTDEATAAVQKVAAKILGNGGNVHTATGGSEFKLGSFSLRIIGYYPDKSEENDRSVAVLVESDGVSFLFTGDGEQDFERSLIEDNPKLDCDVIKAGHHGDDSASSSKLLKLVTPKYAVVSCGAGNSYSHPHKDTLKRFENIGAEILRTDISGDITFYIKDGELSVKTQK